MSFTNVFGGQQLQPAWASYRAVALSVSTQLVWPIDSQSSTDYVASTMDVTPTSGGLFLTVPPANQVSSGQSILFRNLGSSSFGIKDYNGNVVATVNAGTSLYFYLQDNSSVGGTWTSVLFGAGSSSLSAASIVGYGLTVTGSTLSTAITINSTSVNFTIAATDRGSAYNWTGGAGTATLPVAGTVGNNFFWAAKNSGSGVLTLTPAGGDLIDGVASVGLQPTESCWVVSAGAGNWYTIGRGRTNSFAFTQLTKNVTTGTYTLTISEASNLIQNYQGALVGNVIIVLPAVVQIYYVKNSTTNAFTLTLESPTPGTTVQVSQGQTIILYCDGVNVVNAATSVIGTTTNISGGAAGEVLYQSGIGTTGFTAVGSAGQFLTSQAAAAPTWTTPNLGVLLANPAGGALTAGVLNAVMNNAAYTLPTLVGSSGTAVLVPGNASSVPTSITTSDGWSVATGFVAGTTRLITPISFATAHGVWSGSLQTPPINTAVTGAAALTTILGTASLSATLAVVLYQDGTSVFVVAVNPATGIAGTASNLGGYAAGSGSAIYADTATSFVAFFSTNQARAGTIAGTVITLGTVQTTSNVFNNTPIQMAAGLYALARNNLTDLQCLSVAGNVITVGAAVASGTATAGDSFVLPCTAGTFLVVYLAIGGGTTTRQFSARVASVAGTVITLNTASGAATNIMRNAQLRSCGTFALGSSYFGVGQDGGTATTGNWYGITVSGTTATVGAVSVQANNEPAAFFDTTFIVPQLKKQLKYNASTFLFGHLSGGPLAITISGSTLTFGAATGVPAQLTNFTNDITGAITYAVGSSLFDKITVTGTTPASSFEVAAVPTIIQSDTLTDKVVNYSGSWYSWTLPTMSAIMSAGYWVGPTATGVDFYGPVT